FIGRHESSLRTTADRDRTDVGASFVAWSAERATAGILLHRKPGLRRTGWLGSRGREPSATPEGRGLADETPATQSPSFRSFRQSAGNPLGLLQRLDLNGQNGREVADDGGPGVAGIGRAVDLAAGGSEVDAAGVEGVDGHGVAEDVDVAVLLRQAL